MFELLPITNALYLVVRPFLIPLTKLYAKKICYHAFGFTLNFVCTKPISYAVSEYLFLYSCLNTSFSKFLNVFLASDKLPCSYAKSPDSPPIEFVP